MITASTLIAVETLATKDQLWAPPAFFLHDWTSNPKLRSSFYTDVVAASSAGEVRSGLSPKPSRSIELSFLAMDQAESALLRSWMARMATARTPVPLFPDQTTLTTNATIGSSTLACDTTCRRFFAGGRVVIWPATAQSMALASQIEWGIIAAVSANALGLTAPIAAAHAAGSLVAPVMEADLIPQLTSTYITDMQLRARLTFRETFGAMTLDPAVAVGTVPAGVSTSEGIPVFAIAADWSGRSGDGEGGYFRPNETSRLGLVNYTEVHGDRPQVSQKSSFLQMDRTAAWQLMSFYDSRGGRQKIFLAADLTTDFIASATIGAGDTTISLVATTPLLDWDWRTHLALVLQDDSIFISRISDVSRDAGVDEIELLDAVPTLSAPIMRIAAAFKARFGTDELEETWITDRVMSASLPQVEVMREDSVDLEHLPDAPAAGTRRASSPQGGPVESACDGGSTTFDFTFYNFSTSGGGLVDDGTGLVHVVTTGVGMVWQGFTVACADIAKVDGHWEATINTSKLRSSARLPPKTLPGWSVDPDYDPAVPINVQCRETATLPDDLPDVLRLLDLIEKSQVNWGDGAGAIFDGNLHRISSGIWVAKEDGSAVRVKQRDGSYALMTIELHWAFGLGTIYLNGYPGSTAYAIQSATATGTYGNTSGAYAPINYNTTDVGLPPTLRVNV